MTPEDPKETLGPELWEVLGRTPEPSLPVGFDAGFRALLAQESARGAARDRRRWPLLAGAGATALLAAGLVLALRTPPPAPADDLALVADLALVENLDLLQDLDTLMAWDGTVP